MKNLIRITDLTKQNIEDIFATATKIEQGQRFGELENKTVVMFFPATSLRTRITFEKGVNLLGGQGILFESETLEGKEEIKDVIGYLNNWVDLLIVRHHDLNLIEKIAQHAKMPIINAMTSENHPCEILSDLFSLFQLRADYLESNYLIVAKKGNIASSWYNASKVLGFKLTQSCPPAYRIPDCPYQADLSKAIINTDIVCTDSLGVRELDDFKNHQITTKLMAKANPGALLNPCPPFFRGQEVSDQVIASDCFVGYEFKQSLLSVQQAIMINLIKANQN